MIAQTTKMRFTFLTSGPSFGVEVPAEVPSVPEVSSPILSGIGPRSFVFTPSLLAEELAQGIAQGGKFLEMLTDRDGRQVELYQRIDPPLTWWLRWPLSTGSFGTHLREEDGIERADTVVEPVDRGKRPDAFSFYSPH
jgi:hypothetical protein